MRNMTAFFFVLALLATGGCTKVGTGPATAAGNPWTQHGHLHFSSVGNPKNNLSSRVGYDIIKSIDKVDDYTVRVHLKARWSPFVNSFFTMSGEAYPLLPAHILSKYPDINRVPYNEKPIGTGPFKITEWKRGAYVHFEANLDYWRGPPKLKRVDYLIIPDENTMVTQLKTHEIDLFYNASTGVYPQVKDIPGTHMYQTPFTQYSQIMFNTRRLLADKTLRKALAYGTDRNAIINNIAHGVPIPGDTDQPPFSWAFNPKVSRRSQAHHDKQKRGRMSAPFLFLRLGLFSCCRRFASACFARRFFGGCALGCAFRFLGNGVGAGVALLARALYGRGCNRIVSSFARATLGCYARIGDRARQRRERQHCDRFRTCRWDPTAAARRTRRFGRDVSNF